MAKQQPKLYGVTADQAKRIRRTCERVEGTPPGRTFGTASNAKPWQPGIVRAKVTTTIPGGTFASPSDTGEAQIYEKNAAGAWVASPDDPVQVFNQFGGGDIDVDAGVLITWIAGDWFVVAADCPPEPEE